MHQRSELAGGVLNVVYLLVPAFTFIGVLMMPKVVGADWPGWSSTVWSGFGLALLLFIVCVVLAGRLSFAVRWVVVAAILALIAKVAWSWAGAAASLIAVAPVIAIVVLAVLLLLFVWPREVSRAVAAEARRRGWQPVTPDEATFPATALPLEVGRPWIVRSAIAGEGCVAFEVRWLHWFGLLARPRRLAVVVGPILPVGLPALEVRPQGLGNDHDLESEEFNRAFTIKADDPRYLTDMLHPRTMQTLLDARPLGLIVVGDALVTYDERGLTADALTRLLPATAAIAAGITPYVKEHWGFRTGPPGPLRFTGRRWNQSQSAWVFRLIGGSATILGVTLAACLIAALAEGLTLARSGANLWTAVGVLTIVALGCQYAARPRKVES